MEGGRIQFRGDLFNASNHSQRGLAVNTVLQTGNVNAGQVNSTRRRGQVQLSLKYIF